MVKIEKGIPVPPTQRGNFAGYEGGTVRIRIYMIWKLATRFVSTPNKKYPK